MLESMSELSAESPIVYKYLCLKENRFSQKTTKLVPPSKLLWSTMEATLGWEKN